VTDKLWLRGKLQQVDSVVQIAGSHQRTTEIAENGFEVNHIYGKRKFKAPLILSRDQIKEIQITVTASRANRP
jgi:hypothetical protein